MKKFFTWLTIRMIIVFCLVKIGIGDWIHSLLFGNLVTGFSALVTFFILGCMSELLEKAGSKLLKDIAVSNTASKDASKADTK